MTGAQTSRWKRIIGAALFAGAVAAAISFTPGATADPDSINIRFGGDQNETRVVIDLDRATTGRLVESADADRQVVLFLQHVDAASERTGLGRGLVNGWTLRQDLGGARVQLDLARPASVRRRFLLPPADGVSGYRYVVDLVASGTVPVRRITTVAAQDAVPSVAQPPIGTASEDSAFSTSLREALSSAPPRSPARQTNARRVIIVDAGHGGRDSGAIGAKSHEEDVTLAAAQALRRHLEQSGRYRVVMTRSSDVYVSLQDRVRIARRANADLFISLHADAGVSNDRRGASVYTLSEAGGSRVTRVLGRNEWFLGADTGATDRSVGRILLDLTQRSTRNRSAGFAQLLVDHISDHTDLLPNSHRDAGYFVLLAPDVPAALLEMGFITNLEDEQALNDSGRRRQLMGAVADAIDAYFAEQTNLAQR